MQTPDAPDPDDQLDAEIDALTTRMASVPINQPAMQKMVINAAVEKKINVFPLIMGPTRSTLVTRRSHLSHTDFDKTA